MIQKLTPAITYTGVLNPNLRVFDIIMRTDYGTSYNSYVVSGDARSALIEASHLSFSAAYLENIAHALSGKTPDYLVLNHCEPDHTGAVNRLIDLYPNLTLVVSRAGSVYMKNILNRPDVHFQVVSDGDTLDLGNITLQFFSAPFLHWPDSMFTYLKEEQALFTCDFLGAHYCEPEILDSRVHYREAYLGAVKYYYDCIFAPFPAYVQKGLEKIKALPVKMALTSHGPVLSNECELQNVIALYEGYSAPKQTAGKQIPIFYASAYGNTALLAKAMQAGLQEALPEADVSLYNIIDHDMASLHALLNGSDAFLLGCPTLNRDAVAPMWQLLAGIDAINIQKRPALLFGSYGWSGEALPFLQSRLKDLKALPFEEPFRVAFVPTAQDLENAAAFAKRFGETHK